MFKKLIPIFFCLQYIFSQGPLNQTFAKKIISQHLIFLKKESTHRISPIKIDFEQKFYLNSNLPNLENLNGLYISKGYGAYTSIFFEYKNNFFLAKV